MKEKIENLKNIESDFFLAANSFCFDLKKDIENEILWINPVWRLIKNQNFINSSFECPIYQDYENDEEYNSDFENWCKKLDYLKGQKILEFQITETNDIKVRFEDSSLLETFRFDEDETWYLQDKEND
ncbi:hypothetical protein [Epilithonimonas sp.]|uniref:hypothetical protein n=1 Tax=Epilithonimonas sp. TaxID=2894511 RepID=UPI002898F226|nr:hypothetical protein [Epilithonimonas sp.]